MTLKPTIVCAGYMPLDLIYMSAHVIDRRAGGTAANVASILAFLGWDAFLAGQIGDDTAGVELLADLGRTGVDTAQLFRAANTLTPRLVHDVRSRGHAFSYRCPKCASRFPHSRPLTLSGAEVCAQQHPRPAVFFFDRANSATIWLAERYANEGSVIVFEPSVPANAALLTRALSVAHIVKHSDDRSVGGFDDLSASPKRGQLRIITHGVNGLELEFDASGPTGTRVVQRFPAIETIVVDAAGAGDWTTAGFLAKVVRNSELQFDCLSGAVRFGQALAALSCTVIGARGLMHLSRESVMRRAREVITQGRVASRPRISMPSDLLRPIGMCPDCLMPLAETNTNGGDGSMALHSGQART